MWHSIDRARIMPSLCWYKYVQRVWTRTPASLILRGVTSDVRAVGIAFQVFSSRIVTTCEGCSQVSKEQSRNRTTTCLEIHVLESPHDDAIGVFLGGLQFRILGQTFNVDQAFDDIGVESAFICQSLNVLGRVRIDVLQRACKLIVKSFDKRHDATRNT